MRILKSYKAEKSEQDLLGFFNIHLLQNIKIIEGGPLETIQKLRKSLTMRQKNRKGTF